MDFNQYGTLLLGVNGVAGLASSPWLFLDGMNFGDDAVWWPSSWQKRPVPHEGLDLGHFETDSGVQQLFSGFMVVSPVSGVVVDICSDFLDQTLWINPHDQPQNLVILSHVEPLVGVGERVICGDPVGMISYPVINVPWHLHLSVLSGQWQSIPSLTWDAVHRQSHARFIYPTF